MKRKRTKRKLKTTVTINIACEGLSEKSYIEGLLKEYNLLTSNITITNLEGKGMLPFVAYFENNVKLYRIFIFIIDLDRARQKEIELRNLNKLIDKVEKSNLKNNIFLSNPDFEVFVAASIGMEYDDLWNTKYEKGNGVYQFIRTNGGSYERAIENLENLFYYDKQDLDKKGSRNKENIDIKHSNLVYFLDYMKKLIEL
ncbi:RloB domain-containing protein [uncultured Anaerococcus sp.]|uniref:RloB domain-containing protein n=1 Tax=uncultured Anaerococcus sp. TaxID=293428 RepID=UPI00260B179D|nr:RloB domain-containing protein [uncultured Anaerococcus sp.]